MGHLNAKIDSKEKDFGNITQRIEDLRKEFEVVFEKVDCSENNLLSDVYSINEKLNQIEVDSKRNQKFVMQKIEQMNESLKLTGPPGSYFLRITNRVFKKFPIGFSRRARSML